MAAELRARLQEEAHQRVAAEADADHHHPEPVTEQVARFRGAAASTAQQHEQHYHDEIPQTRALSDESVQRGSHARARAEPSSPAPSPAASEKAQRVASLRQAIEDAEADLAREESEREVMERMQAEGAQMLHQLTELSEQSTQREQQMVDQQRQSDEQWQLQLTALAEERAMLAEERKALVQERAEVGQIEAQHEANAQLAEQEAAAIERLEAQQKTMLVAEKKLLEATETLAQRQAETERKLETKLNAERKKLARLAKKAAASSERAKEAVFVVRPADMVEDSARKPKSAPRKKRSKAPVAPPERLRSAQRNPASKASEPQTELQRLRAIQARTGRAAAARRVASKSQQRVRSAPPARRPLYPGDDREPLRRERDGRLRSIAPGARAREEKEKKARKAKAKAKAKREERKKAAAATEASPPRTARPKSAPRRRPKSAAKREAQPKPIVPSEAELAAQLDQSQLQLAAALEAEAAFPLQSSDDEGDEGARAEEEAWADEETRRMAALRQAIIDAEADLSATESERSEGSEGSEHEEDEHLARQRRWQATPASIASEQQEVAEPRPQEWEPPLQPPPRPEQRPSEWPFTATRSPPPNAASPPSLPPSPPNDPESLARELDSLAGGFDSAESSGLYASTAGGGETWLTAFAGGSASDVFSLPVVGGPGTSALQPSHAIGSQQQAASWYGGQPTQRTEPRRRKNKAKRPSLAERERQRVGGNDMGQKINRVLPVEAKLSAQREDLRAFVGEMESMVGFSTRMASIRQKAGVTIT